MKKTNSSMPSVITLHVKTIHQQLRPQLIPDLRHPRYFLSNAAPLALPSDYSLESYYQTFLPRDLRLWNLQLYIRAPHYGSPSSSLYVRAPSCGHLLLDAKIRPQVAGTGSGMSAAATVLPVVVRQSLTRPFACKLCLESVLVESDGNFAWGLSNGCVDISLVPRRDYVRDE